MARRTALVAAAIVGLVAAGGAWWWGARPSDSPKAAVKSGSAAVRVSTALVEGRDVPVRLRSNGTVVALQSVDIRAQITSTVREVHIREGQSVAKGELLVSLDSRAEEAGIAKAEAQVQKDRADLANASRTLERQRQLFEQKFISQSALDAAQNQVESLKGQLAVDLAAVEAAKVDLGNTRIRSSFAGRTGAIGVRPGSLVQPNGAVLVTVTQVDPTQVAFTLPEKELAGLQRAIAAGPVSVEVWRGEGLATLTGLVDFIDNAVDTATGTIRVKARFANGDNSLWPGMYVKVAVAPRTLTGAAVVPVQSVQTGPEKSFVYLVGEDRRVAPRDVSVAYIDEGIAVVEGVEPGRKVVVEGAQNLRPGSLVTEGGDQKGMGTGPEGGDGKSAGKGQGKGKGSGETAAASQ